MSDIDRFLIQLLLSFSGKRLTFKYKKLHVFLLWPAKISLKSELNGPDQNDCNMLKISNHYDPYSNQVKTHIGSLSMTFCQNFSDPKV
jgi:hypothetical protein